MGHTVVVRTRMVPGVIAFAAAVLLTVRGQVPSALVCLTAALVALSVASQRQPKRPRPDPASSRIGRQFSRPFGVLWPAGAIVTSLLLIETIMRHDWSQLWWRITIGALLIADGLYLQDRSSSEG